MDRRLFLKHLISATAISKLSSCLPISNYDIKKRKLNFLFILVDDLGWADLGCYGSKFYETPNIDRLANEGIKFTNAYAASPVCSPTRASIHSGKYPARMGINFILNDGLVDPSYKLNPPHCETEMKLEEITIAEQLKSNGYKTFFAGKWHLGEEKKYYPENQGYEINIGGHRAGQPASYFYPYKSDELNGYFNVPNLDNGHPGEYLTDRLTNETINFIKANKNEGFFAFLSLYSVHTPLEGKPELVEKFIKKAKSLGYDKQDGFIKEENSCDDYRTTEKETFARTKIIQNNAVYAAMIASVDENIGKLMDYLKKSGIDKNTVVIFFSDNGGLSTHIHKQVNNIPTSNLPLRAGKGWLYEGGIRVPMIMKIPGLVKMGSVCDKPVMSIDFYPTILELAGIRNFEQKLDGISLVPLVKREDNLSRDALFWHMPHYHSSGISPCSAIRWKNYKLIEYFEDGRTELYDLSNDMSETMDISLKNSELTKSLQTKLNAWLNQVNAALPTKNLDYKE